MICEHCDGQRPRSATRAFDVPGRSVLRLCETHAGFWVAKGHRPVGTVELVEVELEASDVGIVAEPAAAPGSGEASLVVPRSVYLRWAAARALWEDVQAEMSTELAKGSVGALALSSELNGNDRRSA